ncbi:hypothetical protein FPQ18DRAFT_302080 [Pyronema domesticum]|nr:hypothetical protein FPQ18DRAFT_302080 [Pyronema domesticum]
MSDPLSISASIIALLQVSAKVVEFVSNLSGTKIASRVTSKLTAMDILLRRLQALVKDLDSAFSEEIVGVKSYAVLEDLVIVLTGCVCAYAELDVIVGKIKRWGMTTLDSAIRYAKWALMEGDISTIISNLQNYKSSLTVTLALFVWSRSLTSRSGSLPEVFRHLDDLSQSTAHILKSHQKLEQRIQESISEPSNSSIDTESIRSTSCFVPA